MHELFFPGDAPAPFKKEYSLKIHKAWHYEVEEVGSGGGGGLR